MNSFGGLERSVWNPGRNFPLSFLKFDMFLKGMKIKLGVFAYTSIA